MVEFLRHAVSQKKRRYQKNGFDLDLTYITDRIIAMGFPSGDISDTASNSSALMAGRLSRLEQLYRNPIDEVVRFFNTYHKGHYKIYNLCIERLYDPERFDYNVCNIPFEDHNCPRLSDVSLFCESASQWLAANKENVVVVHCKAGKSRTGLMICALLLHLDNEFNDINDTIAYYDNKRTTDGKGLTLASQRRYVSYYDWILRSNGGMQPSPAFRTVTTISVINPPQDMRFVFVFRTHDRPQGIFSTQPNNQRLLTEFREDGSGSFDVWFAGRLVCLQGDFKMEMYYSSRFKSGRLGYAWLNTSFIEDGEGNYVQSIRSQDIDKRDKGVKLPEGFEISLALCEDLAPELASDATDDMVELPEAAQGKGLVGAYDGEEGEEDLEEEGLVIDETSASAQDVHDQTSSATANDATEVMEENGAAKASVAETEAATGDSDASADEQAQA